MKKIWVKYLLVSFALVTSIAFISCSDNTDEVETVITVKDLPVNAQTFLNTYFKGIEVTKVEKQTIDEVEVYEVELENGYDIVFNSMGEWQQIEAPDNMTVPTDIIPEPIYQTLNEQYHGYGVIEINTQGQYYHVVLSNNQGGASIELLFNMSGEIIPTGDMD